MKHTDHCPETLKNHKQYRSRKKKDLTTLYEVYDTENQIFDPRPEVLCSTVSWKKGISMRISSCLQRVRFFLDCRREYPFLKRPKGPMRLSISKVCLSFYAWFRCWSHKSPKYWIRQVKKMWFYCPFFRNFIGTGSLSFSFFFFSYTSFRYKTEIMVVIIRQNTVLV